MKALYAKAAKGDPRAMRIVLQITERQELASALDTAAKPLPDRDNAILENYLAQRARRASDGGKP